MSDESSPYGLAHRATDDNWSVRAVIDPGPPKRFTVVVDDAGAVVRLTLTPTRARLLRRMLYATLKEAGEQVGTGVTPWNEIRDKKLGRKPTE